LVELTVSTPGDHEQEVKYPDFIVSKPIPVQRGNPRYRHILAIVEIKKPGADPREALAQLVKYSAKARGMANVLQNADWVVPSYLFIGPMYSAVVGTIPYTYTVIHHSNDHKYFTSTYYLIRSFTDYKGCPMVQEMRSQQRIHVLSEEITHLDFV